MKDTEDRIEWDLGESRKRIRYIFLWAKPKRKADPRINDDLYYLKSSTIASVAAAGTIPALEGIAEFRLKNVQIQIDNQYYPPKTSLNIDPDTKNINDLIDNYHKVASSPYQYTNEEFQNIHGVICFDLSAQNENKARDGLKSVIILEKTGAQALNLYALLLEEHKQVIQIDKTVLSDVPL